MTAKALSTGTGNPETDETRRDFLFLATGAVGAVGVTLAAWPFIDCMNPSADVLSLATMEVDLTSVVEGQGITLLWRGKAVFVRRRTSEEIELAQNVNLDDLPDPQADKDRVQKPEWMVLIGICPHLGCIPKGQRITERRGEYGGWFCVCHGSHFDLSGRIRKGPSPTNLPIPPYKFVDDNTILIG